MAKAFHDNMRPKSTQKVTILVMGARGSGKSKFIGVVSGALPGPGKISTSKAFGLDLRANIELIELPAFGDDTRSDADVLTDITDFLLNQHKRKRAVAGGIYLHDIAENRMVGNIQRNYELFQHICGREAMPNAIIVTNKWSAVAEDIGSSRENQLKARFFKPALDAGARIIRHDCGGKSARNILRKFIDNTPEPLLVQRQLIDQRIPLRRTAVGIRLRQFLIAKELKLLSELLAVLEDFEEDGEMDRMLLHAQEERLHFELDNVNASRKRMGL